MEKLNVNSIQVLLGAEGIKQAYNDCLKETSIDIVCLANNYTRVIGGYFEKIFAPNLYGKVKTREILPDTQANRNEAKLKDQSLNALRFIKNIKQSESDMILTENKAVLISFNETTPMAVVVTELELVKSFQSQFEALWERLE